MRQRAESILLSTKQKNELLNLCCFIDPFIEMDCSGTLP